MIILHSASSSMHQRSRTLLHWKCTKIFKSNVDFLYRIEIMSRRCGKWFETGVYVIEVNRHKCSIHCFCRFLCNFLKVFFTHSSFDGTASDDAASIGDHSNSLDGQQFRSDVWCLKKKNVYSRDTCMLPTGSLKFTQVIICCNNVD